MYRENKKRFKDWVEVKSICDSGLEGLTVMSCWEDGRRKRVPVSRCHGNKRIGEFVRSIGIQFKRIGEKIAYLAQMKPLEGLLILSRQNKIHGNLRISFSHLWYGTLEIDHFHIS